MLCDPEVRAMGEWKIGWDDATQGGRFALCRCCQ